MNLSVSLSFLWVFIYRLFDTYHIIFLLQYQYNNYFITFAFTHNFDFVSLFLRFLHLITESAQICVLRLRLNIHIQFIVQSSIPRQSFL